MAEYTSVSLPIEIVAELKERIERGDFSHLGLRSTADAVLYATRTLIASAEA
jgi:Arc/MetJ-type ribon-helix-helix transcriptional regulator